MKGLLLDNEFDLVLPLQTGAADEQAVRMLFLGAQGKFKEHPDMGIGITSMQGGALTRFLERKIRVQLEAQGFSVKTLSAGEDGVQVEGIFNSV